MKTKQIDLRCLNAFTLKCIAMALMLADHTWAAGLVTSPVWTGIGRIAFPIFAFQVAEGFAKTHNRTQYMQRMLIFALISEIPFNYLTGGNWLYPFHQNVMFTFLLALGCLTLAERARAKYSRMGFFLALAGIAAAGGILGTVLMLDYFGVGVLTVMLFYYCRNFRFAWLVQLVGMWYFNCILLGGQVIDVSVFGHLLEVPQQGLALLALPLLWLYNGKQGPHNKAIQYFGYAFYPGHIIVLVALALLMRAA